MSGHLHHLYTHIIPKKQVKRQVRSTTLHQGSSYSVYSIGFALELGIAGSVMLMRSSCTTGCESEMDMSGGEHWGPELSATW